MCTKRLKTHPKHQQRARFLHRSPPFDKRKEKHPQGVVTTLLVNLFKNRKIIFKAPCSESWLRACCVHTNPVGASVEIVVPGLHYYLLIQSMCARVFDFFCDSRYVHQCSRGYSSR